MQGELSPGSDPLCNNQIFTLAEADVPEASDVCSCPAGLIHMHDCPVTLGLECVHFAERDDAEAVDAVAHADIHANLMMEFLTRTYFHRVRALHPGSDPFNQRRTTLAEAYREFTPEPDDAPDEVGEEYEAERARLLAIRRKREEQRQEREEAERKEKEARARLRAERAIKEAEARAARAAKAKAARPAGSDSTAPQKPRRSRRRRGRKKTGDPAAPKPEGEAAPASDRPRRKRRRRRRKGGGGTSSGPAADPS